MSNFAYLFKFIVVGDTSVGKTCLNLRFVRDYFQENYDVTVGADFGSKIVSVGNEQIKLQIWDTAGQESFRSLTRSYYRAAAGAFLVFDLTRKSTFENLNGWLSDLQNYCGKQVLICLVGNKSDDEDREVSAEEIQKMVKEHNIMYIETSAKTGENVDKCFMDMTELLYEKIQRGDILVNEGTQGIKMGVTLENNEPEVQKKSGCCN